MQRPATLPKVPDIPPFNYQPPSFTDNLMTLQPPQKTPLRAPHIEGAVAISDISPEETTFTNLNDVTRTMDISGLHQMEDNEESTRDLMADVANLLKTIQRPDFYNHHCVTSTPAVSTNLDNIAHEIDVSEIHPVEDQSQEQQSHTDNDYTLDGKDPFTVFPQQYEYNEEIPASGSRKRTYPHSRNAERVVSFSLNVTHSQSISLEFMYTECQN